jgi:hypothetical protein
MPDEEQAQLIAKATSKRAVPAETSGSEVAADGASREPSKRPGKDGKPLDYKVAGEQS